MDLFLKAVLVFGTLIFGAAFIDQCSQVNRTHKGIGLALLHAACTALCVTPLLP